MRLELLKSSWRPVFCWLFIVFFFMTGVTVLIQVWVDEAGIGEVAGIYTAGRTWEKRHGQEHSAYEQTLPDLPDAGHAERQYTGGHL